MKGHWFEFENRKVYLDEDEMHKVHQHYIVQCTADYLRENNPNWTEDKVQAIAIETRRQMLKYDYTEDEAIEIAIGDYAE